MEMSDALLVYHIPSPSLHHLQPENAVLLFTLELLVDQLDQQQKDLVKKSNMLDRGD
jgi:hypothetical protein